MSEKLRAAAQAALEELIASESNAWNVINDIEAALLETQMPTKICGPNLEETLNAAGFYKKKEWVGLTDEEVNSIYETIEKVVGDHWENGGTKLMFPVTLYEALEAKLREKNT